MSAEVIIAVRGGPQAKSRCADALGPAERERLVEAMLADMLEAAQTAPSVRRVHVVTSTPALASLAEGLGARVIAEGSPKGLNAAFETARDQLADETQDAALVFLPGDLPMLESGELEMAIAAHHPGRAVLVPALADGGTGALIFAGDCAVEFAFGPDSLRRHHAAVVKAGLEPCIFEAPSLAFDIDRASDLSAAALLAADSRTGTMLRKLRRKAEAAA